jgi:hypothetical protein
MKKLFFTALVAVVAVGGAYADVILHDEDGTPIATCQTSATNACSNIQGPVYGPEGSEGPEIPFIDYSSLLYN